MGKFISLFAGVGGFDLGMELAGHECVAQVEWDKNAAGVLKRRWPDVPLFCDVSKVRGEDLPDCDFLTYGFPCQDLSVAGKREGLSGERSGLFFEATRLIRELHARGSGIRFALAENVAGLFSADDGRAFARCIGELLESGASEIGWRMFDSQYFGVPQRRKRVFIVADFGGRSCDEIFAITESLPGYPAPSRESGQGIAGDVEAGIGADVYNGELTGEVAPTVTSATGISNASGPKAISWNGDVTPKASEDVSVTLRSQQGGEGVGVAHAKEGPCYENHPGDSRVTDSGETCPTITKRCGTGGGNLPFVRKEENLTVRRLTPKECERLQGFPDEWTIERMELELVDNEWKPTGKVIKQTDGPRYKQMGNAVTVNVAYWLGKRMRKVIDE